MNSFLAVRGLARRFGSHTVFEDVTFRVATGQRLAVLGVSGSGKTTLLRLVAGLDHPTAGSIQRDPALRIGMVFQDLALWPNLTALDNVALALPHLSRPARRAAAQSALDSCHVGGLASRRPGTISIGQQQRVALARALAVEPQLLLLDEPFTSLDLPLKLELLAEVRTQAEARHAALILVTHDLREAQLLCPSALLLEDGRIAASGDWKTLRRVENSMLLNAWRTDLAEDA
jgi:ABC-type sulfate/molybdate transport systems ATPase subunit